MSKVCINATLLKKVHKVTCILFHQETKTVQSIIDRLFLVNDRSSPPQLGPSSIQWVLVFPLTHHEVRRLSSAT